MNVLFVNHYAVSPRSAGGIRHWILGKQLIQQDIVVTILRSRVNHFALGKRELHPIIEIVSGVKFISIPGPNYGSNGARRVVNMLAFAAGVATKVKLFWSADVVVGSSPSPFAAFSAFVMARVFRKPFVLEVRDFWPRTLIDLGSLSEGGPTAKMLYGLERLLVQSSDGVIVVPPDGPQYFAEAGLSPRSLLVLPNFSEPMGEGLDGGQREDLRSRLFDGSEDELESGVVFCYAGSLGLANDLSPVIEAFAKLDHPGARLLIVGDGPERASLELQAKGDPRIRFTGRVNKSIAVRLIRVSDVAVFHLRDAPVFTYGLSPNKVIDYLMAGLPILYAGPEVLNPTSGADVGFSARPGDVDEIQAAFGSFLECSSEDLVRFGSAARRHALEGFSSGAAAERFVNFVNAIATGR